MSGGASSPLLPERVADGHHHLWDLSRNRYPWLQGPAEDPEDPSGIGMLQRDYPVGDFLADAAGVPLLASVHVEAAADRRDALGETRWLQEVADSAGFPQAIVVAAELERPELGEVLAAHLESGSVRGVRQMLDRDLATGRQAETALLGDRRWRAGLGMLAEMRLSFDLQVLPSQLEAAAELAGDFPDTLFLLNHGGYHVPRSGATDEVWRRGVVSLAAHPNVAAKVSGYDAVDPAWGRPGYEDFVLTLVDAFGPDRSLFASNFPLDRRTISFADLVVLTAEVLAGHSPEQRDRFFYANAERLYRLAPRTEGRQQGAPCGGAS